MYVLWLIGSVAPWLGGIGDLIKLPPILADAAIGYLAWSMARELGARQSVALLAALFFILNPVSWFDSAVWGQVDSFGVVFLLLGLRELWRDRPERAAIFTMIAAVIKPQLGILVPLVAIITIRRALWPAGGYGDDAPPDPIEPRPASSGGSCPGSARPAVRSGSDDGPRRPDHDGHPRGAIQPVGGGADSAGAVRALRARRAGRAGGGRIPVRHRQRLQPWALVPGDSGLTLAHDGLWMCDTTDIGPNLSGGDRCSTGTAFIGPLPAVAVGTALLLASIA